MSFAEELLLTVSTGKIDQVLLCAYQKVGLPITLVDNAFTLIAEIGTEALPKAPQRPADDDRESQRAWFNAMASASEPLIDEQSGNPFRALCTDVVFHGERLAKLSFFETRPFTDADKHTITLLAAALSGILWDEAGINRISGSMNASFLFTLLGGHISRLSLEYVQNRTNAGQFQRWEMAAIVIGSNLTPDKNQAKHIIYGLPLCFHTIFDQRLSVLFPAQFEGTLVSSLKQINASMGVSRTFADLEDASAYWPQACYALQRALSQGHDYERYETLFFQEAAELMLKQAGGAAKIRPELAALKDYDAEHGTCLYHTLETFLRLDRSIAATSKAIFVHYNTVKYRLGMIRGITGLSNMDARTAAELLLSYEMDWDG